MRIKHSKYKNTGILFELLVRQITADTLKGGASPAIDLLKSYFVKTELGREYKLYETIMKSKTLTEAKATVVVDSILETSIKLNRSSLKKQKYHLINEIKKHYDLESFFGSKISNYKELASLYTLIEVVNSNNSPNPIQLIENKVSLLEFLSKTPVELNSPKSLVEEFSEFDKDTRFLTYQVLLEKFNSKYNGLSNDQKTVLKEYINSVDSTPDLRNFYNSKIKDLKSRISEESKNIKDKATQIKINEVSKFLMELKKTDKVGDSNLVDLLRFYELIQEIKVANGKVQV